MCFKTYTKLEAFAFVLRRMFFADFYDCIFASKLVLRQYKLIYICTFLFDTSNLDVLNIYITILKKIKSLFEISRCMIFKFDMFEFSASQWFIVRIKKAFTPLTQGWISLKVNVITVVLRVRVGWWGGSSSVGLGVVF